MSLLEKTLADLQAEYNKSVMRVGENTGRIIILEALVESINEAMQEAGYDAEVEPTVIHQNHVNRIDLLVFVRNNHAEFREALAALDLSGDEKPGKESAWSSKTIIRLHGFEDIEIWMLDEPVELKVAA